MNIILLALAYYLLDSKDRATIETESNKLNEENNDELNQRTETSGSDHARDGGSVQSPTNPLRSGRRVSDPETTEQSHEELKNASRKKTTHPDNPSVLGWQPRGETTESGDAIPDVETATTVGADTSGT